MAEENLLSSTHQAGTSSAGRSFAARHAECVFMSGPTQKVIAPQVAAMRRLAAENGRDARDILMFALMTAIVGRSEAEAREKYEVYRRHISVEGALALLSGWTGVDFSAYDPDEPIRRIEDDAGRAAMDNITRADPDRVWTVRTIAEHVGIGGVGPIIIGSPQQVADELEQWLEATDVGGFNLAYAVMPETFIDVVELLVPELQRRGRYKVDYRPGTLREKLFGAGRA